MSGEESLQLAIELLPEDAMGAGAERQGSSSETIANEVLNARALGGVVCASPCPPTTPMPSPTAKLHDTSKMRPLKMLLLAIIELSPFVKCPMIGPKATSGLPMQANAFCAARQPPGRSAREESKP